MRDPNRIDVFCKQLAEYWKAVPDWRFGQLVSNIYSQTSKDFFYIEDEESIKLFAEFFNQIAKSMMARTDRDEELKKDWEKFLTKLP